MEEHLWCNSNRGNCALDEPGVRMSSKSLLSQSPAFRDSALDEFVLLHRNGISNLNRKDQFRARARIYFSLPNQCAVILVGAADAPAYAANTRSQVPPVHR